MDKLIKGSSPVEIRKMLKEAIVDEEIEKKKDEIAKAKRKCKFCRKTLKSEHLLKVHMTKLHKYPYN